MTTAERVLNSRYRIDSLIGRGGMADVYLGHDLSLDRQVAVKMLRPDLARDPQFQTRFRREAQSSASLNHPNIVGVYDTGRAEIEDSHHDQVKTPFIVMEYVDGVTLRHIMHGTPSSEETGSMSGERTVVHSGDEELAETRAVEDSDVLALGQSGQLDGREVEEHLPADQVGDPLRKKIDEALGKPLTEQEAAGYMAGVLSALNYSHEKGIVHRDIKPSNVMVCQDGAVKVMDFGIARALADSASTMTQTSAVVGTAQYLSPEQARGEIVDHRSDLYSAGCVLFELLTNRPPFQGESPVSVAYQHVREEPPRVSELNPDVSPAMESVVAKALAKDPAKRFQDADEFKLAVRHALDGIYVDDFDEAATQAIAAVGAPAARQNFDDVVGNAAPAGMGTPLSARTPEDPELYEEEPRRRRRGWGWLLWLLLLIALVAGGIWAFMRMMETQEVEIPEVEGMERAEAISTLTEANLDPSVEMTPHAEIDTDHAIGTDPEAGATVESDSEIVLFISSGPDEVVIPDGLQGETEETVRAQLEDIGLEVGEVTEEDHPSLEEGTLVSTDPEAGTTVQVGSTVNLVLASGMVEVPSVALMEESEARSVLQDAGFTVTESTVEWETPDYDEGTVGGVIYNDNLVQPGTPLPEGATVSISLAVAPPEEDEDDNQEDDDDQDEDEDSDNDEDEEENGDDEDNGNDDENGSDEDDEDNGDDSNGNGNNGNGNGNGNGNNSDDEDNGNNS